MRRHCTITGVRNVKQVSFKPGPEDCYRRCGSDEIRQTVPDTCSGDWESSVTDSKESGAADNQWWRVWLVWLTKVRDTRGGEVCGEGILRGPIHKVAFLLAFLFQLYLKRWVVANKVGGTQPLTLRSPGQLGPCNQSYWWPHSITPVLLQHLIKISPYCSEVCSCRILFLLSFHEFLAVYLLSGFNIVPGLELQGWGFNHRPQFMSTDSHFWVKSAFNFNPLAKFQTFRHLTSPVLLD